MKRLTLLMTFALMALFAGMAVSQVAQQDTDTGTTARRPAGQMMGRGMMGGGMLGGSMNRMGMRHMIQAEWELYLRYQDDLGLTAGQIEELQDIRIEHLRETTDTRGELQIAEQELEDMLTADEYNVNDVARKISDVHDYQVELEVAVITASAEAREVLTPGQLEQARELRSQGMRGMMSDTMRGTGRTGSGSMMRGGGMMHGGGQY